MSGAQDVSLSNFDVTLKTTKKSGRDKSNRSNKRSSVSQKKQMMTPVISELNRQISESTMKVRTKLKFDFIKLSQPRPKTDSTMQKTPQTPTTEVFYTSNFTE